MNKHTQVDDLLAAYALGVVSDSEAAMVRDHLGECPECAATLHRLSAAAETLPLGVEPVPPPESLRRNLMAQIAQGRQSTSAEIEVLPAPGAISRRVADLRISEFFARPRRWVPAAVAAAIMAGLLTWNLSLQGQIHGPNTVPAGTVATGTLSDAQNAGVGTVTYVPQQHVAVVAFYALRPLAAGRAYELWLINRTGRVQRAGLFIPEADGSKLVLVGNAVSPGDRFAVTDEPAGGSDLPTSVPLITGHI